jgi:hypothetical protein
MEVLQLCSPDSEADRDSSSEEETLMHISPCALARVQYKMSMRLQGTCQGKEILLLIDSGSVESFVSLEAVQQLSLAMVQILAVHVTIADGSSCS